MDEFFEPPSTNQEAQITKADLALVEEALASGKVKVTKCPPMTFTPEDEGGRITGWRKAHQRKKAIQKARAKKKAQQAVNGV